MEHEAVAAGRGGVGNIRSRSTSRGPGNRDASVEHHGHGISALLHRVARSRSRTPHDAPEGERGRVSREDAPTE